MEFRGACDENLQPFLNPMAQIAAAHASATQTD
jgi:hypothetical protein